MDTQTQDNQDEIATRILDAAEARFRTYGYGKTTMVEIATDVNMSAANLYRYFKSKLDIGAALAQRCFAGRHKLLKQVAEDSNLDASAKLEKFVLSLLEHTHAQFSEEPKINELVENIITHRQELVQSKVQSDRALIRQILEQGIHSGEFAISDLDATTEAVQNASVKFCMPLFMSMYPLEEFQRMAVQLVSLLLKGLQKRG